MDERGVVTRLDAHLGELDARLERGECELDVVADESPRRARVRLHQVAAQSASEGRAHHALPRLGLEDDLDRLAHLVGAAEIAEIAVILRHDGKHPATAEEAARAHACSTPISTSTPAVTVGGVSPAAWTSNSMFATAIGDQLALSSSFRPDFEPTGKFASMLASTLASNAASTLIPPSTSIVAVIPAAASISGGMQSFSFSIQNSWKANITTGRKSSSRNFATIVMSGMGRLQI